MEDENFNILSALNLQTEPSELLLDLNTIYEYEKEQ